MNLIVAIEQLLRLLSLAWVDLRRAAVTAPLLLLLLGHLLALLAAADPTFPLWSAAMVPLFEWRFGDLHLHYPQSLIGLPRTGAGLRLLVDLFLGSWALAWIAAAVLRLLRILALPARALPGRGLRVYPSVLALMLGITALWVGLHTPALRWLVGLEGLPYRARILVSYGWALVPAILLAPALYALPQLVGRGGTPWAALAASWRVFRRQPLLTLLLGVLPVLLEIPFQWVLNRSVALAEQLRPEMVLAVMLLQSVVGILATFVVVDAGARLWAGRRGGLS